MTTRSTPRNHQALASYLQTVAPGAIASRGIADSILTRLSYTWNDFRGSERENTYFYELCRAEQLKWRPPYLHFDLERHRTTVMGSTYAAVHEWSVNVETREARITGQRKRQVAPAVPRLDLNPLVGEITAALERRFDHRALKWTADRGTAQLRIGEMIPNECTARTTTGRRTRFRDELAKQIAGSGWSIEMRGTATWLWHEATSS